MKWWVVSFAVAALILAGVCVWFGLGASAMMLSVQYLYNAGLIVAGLAVGLSVTDALFHARGNWVLALSGVILLASLLGLFKALPELDTFAQGPFCGRYTLTNSNYVCAQRSPLMAGVFYLALLFAFSIAALAYGLWPHRKTPTLWRSLDVPRRI